MPEFQTFFTQSNQAEFWYNVRWFLFFIAPLVMISVAIVAAKILFQTIIPAIFPNRRDKKEDDDYDVYRY